MQTCGWRSLEEQVTRDNAANTFLPEVVHGYFAAVRDTLVDH